MRVVVIGATGLIGRSLTQRLLAAGYEVTVITRNEAAAHMTLGPRVQAVTWDPRHSDGAWADALDGAVAVVNLAGENLAGSRWTPRRKQEILSSRLDASRALSEALQRIPRRPATLLQASAIGYYGDGGEKELSEDSPAGAGFLADICRQWEDASAAVAACGVRRVLLRTGVVLDRHDGALPVMLAPLKMGFGGVPGDGRQWFSWIHLDDVSRALQFLLERADLAGPFNLCAPTPIRQRDFYALAARILRRPLWMPLPAALLKLTVGAEFAREMLLAGSRVTPRRLRQARFTFHHPELADAFADLLKDP